MPPRQELSARRPQNASEPRQSDFALFQKCFKRTKGTNHECISTSNTAEKRPHSRILGRNGRKETAAEQTKRKQNLNQFCNGQPVLRKFGPLKRRQSAKGVGRRDVVGRYWSANPIGKNCKSVQSMSV